jgi:hypothetical protein
VATASFCDDYIIVKVTIAAHVTLHRTAPLLYRQYHAICLVIIAHNFMRSLWFFDSTPYLNTVLNNLYCTASHCIAPQDMDEAKYVADYILNGGDKVPPLLLNVPTCFCPIYSFKCAIFYSHRSVSHTFPFSSSRFLTCILASRRSSSGNSRTLYRKVLIPMSTSIRFVEGCVGYMYRSIWALH